MKKHLLTFLLLLTLPVMIPAKASYASYDANSIEGLYENEDFFISAIGQSKYMVNVNRLNIYSGPGTNYSVVGSLSSGKTINVINIRNGWAQFIFNGKNSYVILSSLKKIA